MSNRDLYLKVDLNLVNTKSGSAGRNVYFKIDNKIFLFIIIFSSDPEPEEIKNAISSQNDR